MRRLSFTLWLAMAAALLLGAAPKPKRPHPELVPTRPPGVSAAVPHAPGTKCEACHSTSSWNEVRFAHEKTGFALKEKHRATGCKACHPVDFKTKVPRSCAGCHRDAHGGGLGARCESCHDEASWRTLYTADTHRKGDFPLVGRHATLPCEECHGEARDRAYSRSSVPCVNCHQRDYQRTGGSAIDHRGAGFSTECRQCHGAWSFARASFPAHDACFQLSTGPHAAIGCLKCHTTLSNFASQGACDTRTAACSGCHEHLCARSDAKHTGVPGYRCQDRKCYECHRDPEGR
ncbi:MAG: cytochrome C [Myxococcaceae bacterium]